MQDGLLYILECSSAKRSAKAAAKVCVDMANEGLITEREAILRMEPAKIKFFEEHTMLEPESALEAGTLHVVQRAPVVQQTDCLYFGCACSILPRIFEPPSNTCGYCTSQCCKRRLRHWSIGLYL